MKNLLRRSIVTLLVGTAVTTGYFSASSNSGGPPPEVTGGLGEATCLQGGCHSGTRLNSPTSLTLTGATGYTPGGAAVQLTLRNAGTAGANYGFQLKSVTASDAQAGTLTAGAGLQTVSSGGRTYLEHNTPSRNGTWTFTWTPPATDVGPVTIYVASYNGNGRTQSTISVSSFTLNPTTALPNPIAGTELSVFPNPATERATVGFELTKAANVDVSLLGLDGKMVSNYSLGHQEAGAHQQTIELAGRVPAGQYFVRIASNGHTASRKLVVY